MPNDPGLFAIVPTTLPAPADAIVVGNMSQVMEYIPQTIARDNAMAELERAQLSADQIKTVQAKTRSIQLGMLTDAMAHLSTRLDAFVNRRQKQARRDAEEAERQEAGRIQAELDQLPDPDNPDALSAIENDTPSTHGHIPGGELHDIAVKDEPATEDPEPSLEVEDAG